MKSRVLFVVVLFAIAAFLTDADIAAADGDFEIGSKLEGFSMTDPNGDDHNFSDLKGEKGSLVIFLSAQCPVVKQYNDRINAIAEAYKAKGINFIGIYSNRTESVEWVKKHSETNYKFPVLLDKGNVFADKLGATRTPEVYYFNDKDILDYHGAIDNDRSGNNVSKKFLTTALDQKLGGEEITEKETRAFGCSIKRVKKKVSSEQ